jgi:predicted nucleic acid-binding protein
VIHLDTSFIVDVLRERRHAQSGPASYLLEQLGDRPLRVSVFVVCELEAGVSGSARVATERAAVAEIIQAMDIAYPDASFPAVYGEVLARLPRSRTVATMDLLIAVSALADEAPLVTRNRRHFGVVASLTTIGY